MVNVIKLHARNNVCRMSYGFTFLKSAEQSACVIIVPAHVFMYHWPLERKANSLITQLPRFPMSILQNRELWEREIEFSDSKLCFINSEVLMVQWIIRFELNGVSLIRLILYWDEFVSAAFFRCSWLPLLNFKVSFYLNCASGEVSFLGHVCQMLSKG